MNRAAQGKRKRGRVTRYSRTLEAGVTLDGCGPLIVWFVVSQNAEGMKIQVGSHESDGVTRVCKAEMAGRGVVAVYEPLTAYVGMRRQEDGR